MGKVYGAIFEGIVGTLTIYRIVNARKSSNQSEDGYDDVIIILTNGNPSCGIGISENFSQLALTHGVGRVWINFAFAAFPDYNE